jgi:hypothetical protein
MQFPSLHSLIDKLNVTFRRFPFVIVAALTGSLFAILLIHLPDASQGEHYCYVNILMSCYLAMLLQIAVQVYAERRKLNVKQRTALQLAGIAAITLYYFSLPDHFMMISTIRFALFTIALHLLVAFAPFIVRNELNGFWQYNKNIFLRILTSALYSGVLFAGLALAILAIDQLFKAHINGRTYGYLWVFIVGVFNTWFFLAGFPEKYSQLENETGYPKGLRVFTQYVLLTIITIYLLILYSYLVKICFSAQLPEGWVSYLVLGFSIAGIFSLLLIYPIRNDSDKKWILIYSRFFYLALFPLLVLLFLAIKRRIEDYGITENRYFVLVLACWLAFIAGYFLLSKEKNIKIIPVSLCLVTLLTSFGPWSAFHVSLNSQEKHLADILKRNGLLDNGKIKKLEGKISFEDHKEISSVIEYISEVHGYESLQTFFVQDLDSLMKSNSSEGRHYSYLQVNKILELMNVSYVNRFQNEDEEKKSISFTSVSSSSMDISGYNYFISDFIAASYDPVDSTCSSYRIAESTVTICCNFKRSQLSISNGIDSTLTFDLSDLVQSLKQNNVTNDTPVKAELMTLTAGNDKFSAKVFFKTIYGTLDSGAIKLSRIQSDMMLRLSEKNENEIGEKRQNHF